MKMNKNIIIAILTIGLVLSSKSIAQKNFTMYHLGSTPQSNYLNPGFKQENRVYVSLPLGMQNISFMNSGFKLNDALETRSQDDSLVFNPQKAIASMKDLNYLNFEMSNEIFGLGIKVKENFFSVNITNRFQTRLTYPQDLFELALEGNGNDLLGQRASIDGLGLNFSSYIEYGLGYNRKINEKLTVGGRLKLLSGVANLNTAKSKLGLTTDATTFALTIDGSSEINTSNISPFSDSTVSYNPFPSLFNFENFGIGLDLGASYDYNEKWNFNASILDLGWIKWKSNVSNYISNDVNYTFEGVNLNQALDSVDIGGELSDTIQTIFNQTETNDAYSTALRTKFYLGSKYKINDYFSASALMYNEIIGQNYNVGLSVAGNINVKKWLGFSLNYSTYGRSFNNFGLGLNLKGGPIQAYFMTDNIAAFINPQSARHVHVSFGLNVLVGPKKDKDRKGKSADKVKLEPSKDGEKTDPSVESTPPVQTNQENN